MFSKDVLMRLLRVKIQYGSVKVGLKMGLKEKILSGMMGLAIGDALGVPVEFSSREELHKNPVTDMLEYGTHNQPKGTWSDDSSMAFCTVISLTEKGLDIEDIRKRFEDWYYNDYMTPHGRVFDCGITVANAIRNRQGCDDVYSNGNVCSTMI